MKVMPLLIQGVFIPLQSHKNHTCQKFLALGSGTQ